jgi:hypothetical protein
MEKNNNIKNKFFKFKNTLIEDKRDGFWKLSGSFFRDDTKYITDIDISFVLKYKKMSEYKDDIITIFKKIKKYNDIKYIKLYAGNDNEDQDILLEWTLNDVINGFVINNDKKYYFDDIFDKITQIRFDIIIKLNNYLIGLDFMILEHHNKKQLLERKIYYINYIKWYYNKEKYYYFLKKTKVLFILLIRDKSNNYSKEELNKMKKLIDEIKKFIKDKEIVISNYYKNLTLLKLKNVSSDDLDYGFNKLFKEYATEIFKELDKM